MRLRKAARRDIETIKSKVRDTDSHTDTNNGIDTEGWPHTHTHKHKNLYYLAVHSESSVIIGFENIVRWQEMDVHEVEQKLRELMGVVNPSSSQLPEVKKTE